MAKDPHGPIVRYTSAVGAELVRRARGKAKGRIKKAIKQRYRGDLKDPAIEVYIDKDIAPFGYFYHEGTKPHDIDPKDATVLAFNVGGDLVFAGHVDHPGTPPHPVLEQAAEEMGMHLRIRRH
jgi:hypothetical protein